MINIRKRSRLMRYGKRITFADLFAGMGGMRIGFEQAANQLGLTSECVFSSEIKEHAKTVYRNNFGNDYIYGDITQVDERR